jgi:hypothetical protein
MLFIKNKIYLEKIMKPVILELQTSDHLRELLEIENNKVKEGEEKGQLTISNGGGSEHYRISDSDAKLVAEVAEALTLTGCVLSAAGMKTIANGDMTYLHCGGDNFNAGAFGLAASGIRSLNVYAASLQDNVTGEKLHVFAKNAQIPEVNIVWNLDDQIHDQEIESIRKSIVALGDNRALITSSLGGLPLLLEKEAELASSIISGRKNIAENICNDMASSNDAVLDPEERIFLPAIISYMNLTEWRHSRSTPESQSPDAQNALALRKEVVRVSNDHLLKGATKQEGVIKQEDRRYLPFVEPYIVACGLIPDVYLSQFPDATALWAPRLDEDVCIGIVSYLDDDKDRLSFSRTCKSTYNLMANTFGEFNKRTSYVKNLVAQQSQEQSQENGLVLSR